MKTKDFGALVEARIKEAESRGVFDDLPGKGKPLPKDPLEGLPYEERMAALIHRCVGGAPEEVELIREIAELKDAIAAEQDQTKIGKMRETLAKKSMRLAILFESSGRGVLLEGRVL